MKIDIGKNILRARKEAKMSQEALADACDWEHQSRISGYETGEKAPAIADVLVMAKALGHPDLSALLVRDGTLKSSSSQSNTVYLSRPTGDDVLIDRYNVSASMGGGKANTEPEHIIKQILVSKQWSLEVLLTSNPKDIKVITGDGDSMKPTIIPGDAVFIDTADKNISKHGIFAFYVEDELFIKRIERRPGGTVRILSDNGLYDAYSLELSEFQNWQVCGRVVHVWSGKKID